jgi:hypothetical protein
MREPERIRRRDAHTLSAQEVEDEEEAFCRGVRGGVGRCLGGGVHDDARAETTEVRHDNARNFGVGE